MNMPVPSLREECTKCRNDISDDILMQVEQVILKALAKKPEERFSSIQQFALALEKVLPVLTVQRLVEDERWRRGTEILLERLGKKRSGLVSSLLRMLMREQKDTFNEKRIFTPFTELEYSSYFDQEDISSRRQFFTALDIGTAFAKAIIIEVVGEQVKVLGVGHHPQSYAHMSDGIVTDINGVIANCNEALLRAEESAGGLIAPSTVIGIAGELVKGSSTTVSVQRPQPTKPITVEDLESVITQAQKRLLKSAKERIAKETGYPNIDVRLTNALVVSMRMDGQIITNPIGIKGRNFSLTLFSAFAPLTQLSMLEDIAQGLDLTLVTIAARPSALADCLRGNVGLGSGAIYIDVGAGTTDIALVRQGGIEETRMFALGGRTFTSSIATSKSIPIKDAERIKINYSNGDIKGAHQEEIQAILAPECQTWMDSVELLIDEMAKGELLPPAIYIVGGGSALPDLHERLESFPWTERLPFSRQPIVRTVQPEMVANIIDPKNLLTTAQDITPMALAYQAVGLSNENSVLKRTLNRVINAMHI